MSKVCSKKWGWKISGLMLGFIFLATIIVVKPIGVSTQFVILNGIVWNSISPDLVKKDDTAKKDTQVLIHTSTKVVVSTQKVLLSQ